MSIRQLDSNQTLPLTPASSFSPLDMVTLNIGVYTGQMVVTTQVPIQMMANTSTVAANPLTTFTSTNQGTGGQLTHHEWVWFQLESQAGGSLVPAHMQCQSIALVVHQKLGVMPLRIQQLNYWDVLIKSD